MRIYTKTHKLHPGVNLRLWSAHRILLRGRLLAFVSTCRNCNPHLISQDDQLRLEEATKLIEGVLTRWKYEHPKLRKTFIENVENGNVSDHILKRWKVLQDD